MSTPDSQAEVTKLAFLLDVDESALAFLDGLPASAIRKFRDRATDLLYDQDKPRLELVAQAAKLLPVPVAAKIAQVAFGPVLSAAMAGLLEPSRAVGISQRLPIPFLTESAIRLDPRRAAQVVAALPGSTVAAVGQALAERGLHVIAGRFVGYLPPESLATAVAALSDADLLRTAFVLEDKSRLDELAEMTRDRWPGLITVAHHEGLWTQALDLIGNLPEHRGELGDVAAAQSDEVLTGLVQAAVDNNAWSTVLPVTAAMQPQSLARFAALPAVQQPDMLRTITDAAIANNLVATVLPLTNYLSGTAKLTVLSAISDHMGKAAPPPSVSS